MPIIKNRLFLDCETDGVRRGRQVWDVGLVRYDADGKREWWSIMIEDVFLGQAEPASLAYGHFSRRHPRGGGTPEPDTLLMSEEQAANMIFKVAFDANPAGIVANFDTEALDHMLRRHGLCWTGWHHLVCAENRALGALEIQSQYVPEVAEAHKELLEQSNGGRWKTDDIAAAFGVTLPNALRHTAIGDAVLAEMIILASQVDKVVPLPGVTWEPPPVIREYLRAAERPTQADVVKV